MKIKFTEAPKGRQYKVGDIVEFTGPIPEGYARKFIARGWAEEYYEAKPAAKPDAEKDHPAKDHETKEPAKSEAHPTTSPAIGSQKPPHQPPQPKR